METTTVDVGEAWLSALVALEVFANLLAAVIVILHALHGSSRAIWELPGLVFAATALALLVTAAIADFRGRPRSSTPRRSPWEQ
jgi:hypothetical protein